jgi:hypothetical protein
MHWAIVIKYAENAAPPIQAPFIFNKSEAEGLKTLRWAEDAADTITLRVDVVESQEMHKDDPTERFRKMKWPQAELRQTSDGPIGAARSHSVRWCSTSLATSRQELKSLYEEPGGTTLIGFVQWDGTFFWVSYVIYFDNAVLGSYVHVLIDTLEHGGDAIVITSGWDP